ncbi:MAG: hypothetical protein ACOYOS_18095 [Syntrophales bacterium]
MGMKILFYKKIQPDARISQPYHPTLPVSSSEITTITWPKPTQVQPQTEGRVVIGEEDSNDFEAVHHQTKKGADYGGLG